MKKIILSGMLLWAAISAQGQIKEISKTTTTMDQVLDIHRRVYNYLSARDAKKLETVLEPHFVFTSANGDVQDRNTFLNAFVLNPAIQIPMLETSGQKTVVIGNTAVLTGLMHIRIIRNINTDNVERELWERITETYVQQNGVWTLLALQATYTSGSANGK